MEVPRGTVMLRNPKARQDEALREFTFDAVYDWKYVNLLPHNNSNFRIAGILYSLKITPLLSYSERGKLFTFKMLYSLWIWNFDSTSLELETWQWKIFPICHARQTRNVCWYLSVSAALNSWTFMMRLLDLLWMLCWRDTMVRQNVGPYL